MAGPYPAGARRSYGHNLHGTRDGVLCWSPRFTLSDAERVKMRDRLDLAWTGGGSLLTFLRRLPVVRAMAPRSQMVRWGLVTVYRVQLLIERPCSSACYEAVLQDATP